MEAEDEVVRVGDKLHLFDEGVWTVENRQRMHTPAAMKAVRKTR